MQDTTTMLLNNLKDILNIYKDNNNEKIANTLLSDFSKSIKATDTLTLKKINSYAHFYGLVSSLNHQINILKTINNIYLKGSLDLNNQYLNKMTQIVNIGVNPLNYQFNDKIGVISLNPNQIINNSLKVSIFYNDEKSSDSLTFNLIEDYQNYKNYLIKLLDNNKKGNIK